MIPVFDGIKKVNVVSFVLEKKFYPPVDKSIPSNCNHTKVKRHPHVIHTHTHTHRFNGHFPGEPGLASCPLNSPSQLPSFFLYSPSNLLLPPLISILLSYHVE